MQGRYLKDGLLFLKTKPQNHPSILKETLEALTLYKTRWALWAEYSYSNSSYFCNWFLNYLPYIWILCSSVSLIIIFIIILGFSLVILAAFWPDVGVTLAIPWVGYICIIFHDKYMLLCLMGLCKYHRWNNFTNKFGLNSMILCFVSVLHLLFFHPYL